MRVAHVALVTRRVNGVIGPVELRLLVNALGSQRRLSEVRVGIAFPGADGLAVATHRHPLEGVSLPGQNLVQFRLFDSVLQDSVRLVLLFNCQRLVCENVLSL